MPRLDAAVGGEGGGDAGKLQRRLTRGQTDHLDVAPRNPVPPTSAQRLEGCLLRGEAGGEVLTHALGPPARVGDFGLGETARKKSLAVPFEQVGDAVNVREIDAVADESHG